jgi:hypothetical protein
MLFSFKSRQLTEDERIKRLKWIMSQCEIDDYKTKKFKGLLFDTIPNETGLKTRLEIMGTGGYMEQLIKLSNRDTDYGSKVEKLALEFSRTYGFVPEESFRTFSLCSRALGIKHKSEVAISPEIGQAIQKAQGNFSKKHFNEAGTKNEPGAKEEIRKPIEQKSTYKKKLIRSKANLIKVLIFLIGMVAGAFYIGYSFELDWFSYSFMAVEEGLPIYTNPWIVGTVITTIVLWLVPYVSYKKFDKNIVALYPLMVLLIQFGASSLFVGLPLLYEKIQVILWLTMLGSFVLLTAFSVRLPRGAKDFISYKSITPYYLSAITFFITQYAVRLML